jgi:hypothetical protein
MAPIGANFGDIFLGGAYFPKNGTFCPLYSNDSSSFKDMCFLIRLKVLPDALYGPHLHCHSHGPTSVLPFLVEFHLGFDYGGSCNNS